MIFRLHKDRFDILYKKVEEAADYISKIEAKEDEVQFEVKDDDVQEVQLLINDEIVASGLDNQDQVNELGTELYTLYDEILYQKKKYVK